MNKFQYRGLEGLGERICLPPGGDREAKHVFADRLTPHLLGAGYGSNPEGVILITGASGMLGRDLVEVLSKEHEVVGLDVKGSRFIVCDITDREKTIEVICDAKPEIVIHTAAYTDVDGCEKNPDLAYRVNGIGTQNVALACKECKAVMAYISTDFVFDGKKGKPYLESDKPNPLSIYGKSKLEGEKYISSLLDKYFIIRTSWLFGKHGKNFVDTILKLAKEKKELRVVNDQIGSPTYTKDLAQAISKLISNFQFPISNYGIYHISNSGSCSWYEFAQKIIRTSHITHHTSLKPISSGELNRPAKRPKFSVLDNSRYIRIVGEPLRLWQKALREYLTTSEF